MLKKSIVSVLLAVMCGGGFAAFAGDDVAKVSASGKAEKAVKADTAWIILYLSADGILMTDAEKAYQEKFAKLESALKTQYKDIQSIEQKAFSIGQKRITYYGPDQNKQPQPEVRKQIIIALPADTKLASDIIDTAIRNGAALTADNQSYYSGQLNSVVIYGLKEAADIEKEVQKMAFDDCKKNAAEIAALAGGTTGKVLMLSVAGAPQMPQMYVSGINMPLPIKYFAVEPDKIKVTSSVNATFELKN
ncbi:MAG: SIMPL domain-containing protein [Victivallaceae bacterium]